MSMSSAGGTGQHPVLGIHIEEYGLFLVPAVLLRILPPGWKVALSTLHFSEPASTQRNGEHYPKALVLENITKQRQEL